MKLIKWNRVAVVAAMIAGAALTFAPSAEAAFILRMTTSAAGPVTVFDGGPGDVDMAVNNSILYSGALGKFILNIQTAATNVPGTPQAAEITVTSNLRATAADSLKIELTATGFFMPATPGHLEESVAGTGISPLPAGSNASIQGWKDLTNAEFGKAGVALGPAVANLALVPFTPAVGSIGHGAVPVPYSLYLLEVVTVTGATQQFGTVGALSNVPEPMTLGLFGLGLAATGLLARRRK